MDQSIRNLERLHAQGEISHTELLRGYLRAGKLWPQQVALAALNQQPDAMELFEEPVTRGDVDYVWRDTFHLARIWCLAKVLTQTWDDDLQTLLSRGDIRCPAHIDPDIVVSKFPGLADTISTLVQAYLEGAIRSNLEYPVVDDYFRKVLKDYRVILRHGDRCLPYDSDDPVVRRLEEQIGLFQDLIRIYRLPVPEQEHPPPGGTQWANTQNRDRAIIRFAGAYDVEENLCPSDLCPAEDRIHLRTLAQFSPGSLRAELRYRQRQWIPPQPQQPQLHWSQIQAAEWLLSVTA